MPYLHNIIFILPKTNYQIPCIQYVRPLWNLRYFYVVPSRRYFLSLGFGNIQRALADPFPGKDEEDNSLVGSIGIITDPKRENTRTRMLGYWLKECHWGKGMASEATRTILDYGFNVLGLHLISANCYPHNTRSRLLLERNGFVYEGILHEAEMTYDGHVYDHLCFYQKKGRVPMD